ncbi:hypothetical protein CU098_002617, partial [Rhizopus stolonifer]
AKEYHPDKNKDGAEKFKEISNAYSILVDPERRKEYLSKKSTEMPSHHSSYPFPMDPFGAFGFNFSYTRETPRPRPEPPKSSYNIRSSCRLTLEDIFQGSKLSFSYRETIDCQTCHGDHQHLKRFKTCEHCGGKGTTTKAANHSRKIPSHIRCSFCLGRGSQKYYINCKGCNNTKYVDRKVSMKVPKGVHSGHALQLKNKGNLMPDGKTRGSVIFRVEEQRHPVFVRRGDHLYITVKISLKEALLGFKNKVICTHLDGRTMTATQIMGETIKPGSQKVIKGEGMPIFGSQNEARGDLYINFHVEFPDTIQIPKTREAKVAIDDLFETEQEREAKENAIVIDDEDERPGSSENNVISIEDNDKQQPETTNILENVPEKTS